MNEQEKYNLELKREVTRTFLKTVSAYANYNDGRIIFGVNDDGGFIGIRNAIDEALKIENMINDSIEPIPSFYIEIEDVEDMSLIILDVRKGRDAPYYYKGKAYKRSDTATLEVDRFELRRLAINGINIGYEERRASSQNLSFNKLEAQLKKELGIDNISIDVLKTLNLYSKDGYYNIAGELLADKNDISFSGIDITKFGKNINQIQYRESLSKVSLLEQYDRAIKVFGLYYQYEEIKGYTRVKQELIPKEAFREVVANAIVHRVWDVNSYIQISMYDDKIEIRSPGGLPEGISEEEYLYGTISVLRNPTISGIFYRLNIIEQFGTGIARINDEYKSSMVKPSFYISKNNINIQLPVIKFNESDLSEDEDIIYNIFKSELELSRKELEDKSGFGKSKTLRIINNLVKKNIIKRLGKGPGTTYRLR